MQPPIFHRLPSDSYAVVLKRLNVRELANLRTTSLALSKDKQIEERQESLNPKACILRFFGIAKRDIPHVLDELDSYQTTLRESFLEKDLAEITLQVRLFESALQNESTELWLQQREEDFALKDIHDDRQRDLLSNKFQNTQRTIVNELKTHLLAQEHVIATWIFCPESRFGSAELDQQHQQKVITGFGEYGRGKNISQHKLKDCPTGPEYFQKEHEKQDKLALFSSQPKEMQSFLKQRHEHDYTLQYNWLKSTLIKAKVKKQELTLLDKKFVHRPETKNKSFVLGWPMWKKDNTK